MALEPDVTATPTRHFPHPLIDWNSAIAGTLVAIAIGFTLLILGVAIGASAVNPWASAREQAPTWTAAGGLWLVFSQLFAIQVGAFVAARAARWPDQHSGMLQGLVVWALVFTLGAVVLGFGVAGVLSGDHGMSLGRAVDAAQIATGEPGGAREMLTPAQVDALQDATAMTAWWAVASMVLGAVGAVAGGRLGAAHPDWLAHNRTARPITMADKV